MQVYKIGVLWKKVLTKRYKNIVYCVHIEIENAVRCTRKEQWSRNEFCWLRCFFLSYVRKEWSRQFLCPRRFHRNLQVEKRRKCMPRNKRESLIYTVLMCFTMVLWMSIYNVTLHMGALNLTTIREAWIGFPIAYVFAMCMDWFVVSGPAKGFAFRFLVKPESPVLHKVIAVSCSMVVPMVIIMSLYGALEGCVKSGNFGPLLIIWLTNIPKNFVMALPFQLIVAGPLVRKVFRGAFPEGTVLA